MAGKSFSCHNKNIAGLQTNSVRGGLRRHISEKPEEIVVDENQVKTSETTTHEFQAETRKLLQIVHGMVSTVVLRG